jgi:hypothetical protein
MPAADAGVSFVGQMMVGQRGHPILPTDISQTRAR